ncbi:hypothetical protein O9H85_00110 [Paenibacillus filicis]|uniref:Uncharacterized protein n=1 Tax=Paenibacillus gyeongsangnamensis TaxID=3388067 RepID=A0ABT4Q1W5_9BACL|nr:hypothetical protein [Paenibacillus filicis]MCZ8510867.1 hypothetical protein [Paenibacillus filicis]
MVDHPADLLGVTAISGRFIFKQQLDVFITSYICRPPQMSDNFGLMGLRFLFPPKGKNPNPSRIQHLGNLQDTWQFFKMGRYILFFLSESISTGYRAGWVQCTFK